MSKLPVSSKKVQYDDDYDDFKQLPKRKITNDSLVHQKKQLTKVSTKGRLPTPSKRVRSFNNSINLVPIKENISIPIHNTILQLNKPIMEINQSLTIVPCNDIIELEVIEPGFIQDTLKQSDISSENKPIIIDVQLNKLLIPFDEHSIIINIVKDNNVQLNKLIDPSDEQTIIVNAIKDNNVKVNAVAGSGKTTTILHIANKYKAQQMLVLTFNKKLKLETKDKTKLYNLNNLEVHTYHSFGVKYYNGSCSRDPGLIQIVDNKTKHRRGKSINYDLIIIDEIQDMTPLLYNFTCKILKDNNKTYKLCVMGDPNQCIYKSLKHADEKYLINAENLFNFNKFSWNKENLLSVSYRLGETIATFINKCILKQERIKSISKFHSEVDYIICNTFNAEFIYNEHLKPLLKQYKLSDIFILANSVKETTPIIRLSNFLSEKGIDMYVANDSDTKLDARELENKLVFSTFHQVKGLERKVVIVYGFDDGYYIFGDKKADKTKCPNVFYVALTRCKEKLILLHNSKQDYMPFLDKNLIHQYCNFMIIDEISIKLTERPPKIWSITELLKWIRPEIKIKLNTYFKTNKIQSTEDTIIIETTVKQDHLQEQVSDITGIAIPSYFEYKHTNKLTILDILKNDYNKLVDIVIKRFIKDIDITQDMNTDKLLRISNAYKAYTDNLHYRLNQIKYYNWLSMDNLNKCMDRMSKQISDNYQVEVQVCGNIKFEILTPDNIINEKIAGQIDYIDKNTNTIWEIKCVGELAPEHYLQLACYAYLYETNFIKKENELPRQYKLFNLLTNEIQEITFNKIEDLKEMMQLIVRTRLNL